jgi:hypothetical protein
MNITFNGQPCTIELNITTNPQISLQELLFGASSGVQVSETLIIKQNDIEVQRIEGRCVVPNPMIFQAFPQRSFNLKINNDLLGFTKDDLLGFTKELWETVFNL